MERTPLITILAQVEAMPSPANQLGSFVQGGGIFMLFILLCSLIATGLIIHRFLSLRWHNAIPNVMGVLINQAKEGKPEAVKSLQKEAEEQKSPLARTVYVAFGLRDQNADSMRSGVEAAAREEIVKLQNGLPAMEVIITIAPLLGLLGTVSGLISVFGVFGGSQALEDPDPALIAAGIAEALYTTIGGLAVAVPVVIAHSYFNKKIERMAVRMEVLLGEVISGLVRSKGKPGPLTDVPIPSPLMPPPKLGSHVQPPSGKK